MHKDTSWYLFLQSSSSVVTQNWLHCEYHLTHCLANQPESHKMKSSYTVMKTNHKSIKPRKAHKAHEKRGKAAWTFHPFTTASVSFCLLFFVWCWRVGSTLESKSTTESTWVPRSGDLKSPKLLLSSIPAMHQGVETLQMQKCPSSLHQLLHVELWIFLYLQNIPWDWQVFAGFLFNEISYQEYKGRIVTLQFNCNPHHGRNRTPQMDKTQSRTALDTEWWDRHDFFSDSFFLILFCTAQCSASTMRLNHATMPVHANHASLVLLAEPRSLGVRQDCFQVVLESELKHFVFCSVAKN